MALTTVNYYSDEQARNNQKIGQNLNVAHYVKGNLKCIHFKYTSPGGGIAANSVVSLGKIYGPAVVLPNSYITASAFGTGRTIDLGFQEYTGQDGATVVADGDTLLDGFDVSAAVTYTQFGASTPVSDTKQGGKEVTGQTDILMTVLGGTMPAAAVVEGWIFYSAGSAA